MCSRRESVFENLCSFSCKYTRTLLRVFPLHAWRNSLISCPRGPASVSIGGSSNSPWWFPNIGICAGVVNGMCLLLHRLCNVDHEDLPFSGIFTHQLNSLSFFFFFFLPCSVIVALPAFTSADLTTGKPQATCSGFTECCSPLVAVRLSKPIYLSTATAVRHLPDYYLFRGTASASYQQPTR